MHPSSPERLGELDWAGSPVHWPDRCRLSGDRPLFRFEHHPHADRTKSKSF
ncbi:MAG: hypothetical protein ACKO1W_12445 [Microcystaceae cyanobacterium]